MTLVAVGGYIYEYGSTGLRDSPYGYPWVLLREFLLLLSTRAVTLKKFQILSSTMLITIPLWPSVLWEKWGIMGEILWPILWKRLCRENAM